jgi:hypothetical protein
MYGRCLVGPEALTCPLDPHRTECDFWVWQRGRDGQQKAYGGSDTDRQRCLAPPFRISSRFNGWLHLSRLRGLAPPACTNFPATTQSNVREKDLRSLPVHVRCLKERWSRRTAQKGRTHCCCSVTSFVPSPSELQIDEWKSPGAESHTGAKRVAQVINADIVSP